MTTGRVVCITGIDTDIGKSIVTGLIGRYLLGEGYSVITQKICQTGCLDISEDIQIHRKIMGIDLQEEDKRGLTCPYVFAEPCSPHLAALLEGQIIDLQVISNATKTLRQNYDYVLLEGVGGLMVPIVEETLLIDYLRKGGYDHILTSCSRLGSINHTISALELLKSRGMYLLGIVYNRYFDNNPNIALDSKVIFSNYLRKYGHLENIVDIFPLTVDQIEKTQDFSDFFQR